MWKVNRRWMPSDGKSSPGLSARWAKKSHIILYYIDYLLIDWLIFHANSKYNTLYAYSIKSLPNFKKYLIYSYKSTLSLKPSQRFVSCLIYMK